MKWSDMRELLRARRAGASLGDLAVMKFAMYAGPAPEHNARLRERGLPACLEVDLDEMRTLPEGTVGRAYARHLDDRGLSPLAISDECKRRYADQPLPLRYTTTHDLFHVLTGFTTNPAGEIGLFAFMMGQGLALGGSGTLWLARTIYSLGLPLHARGMWHNIRVGLRLGARAANLIEQPLESFLRRPLVEVRRELKLPAEPALGGIVPGRRSALLERLAQPVKPAAPVTAAA